MQIRSEPAARLELVLAQQALLARVAHEIGPADELEPVLRTILASMRSLVEFRGGTICLVDDHGVYVAASDPPVSVEVARSRVPVGTGLAGRCVQTGEAVYSADVTADQRVDQRLAAAGSNRTMRSYLAVPLVCLGEIIGVLQVDSTDVGAFDDDDLRLLNGLATQVAGAIESARRFEEVRRLDDARAMFIARVSHELRTPLTILRGFTTSMVHHPEQFALGADAQVMLGRIDGAGSRLQSLVEELITASTVETGLLLKPSPEDLDLREVLEAARRDAVAPDEVAVHCGPGLRASTDPSLLRQVLNLLVQNALAYAGAAELRAEASDDGHRTVSVVDNGPGVPDDRKAGVFERFQRGEHAQPGWGLGLNVASQLAHAIGTEVVLADTPGGGATFSLVLPAES
ncbi:MAG: GAF domain-containing sensor histidine kinase [Acidimicrobiia bacterium]|nr:GAF domain-containing sensor histidine kinase [Acidimicrobiia bacterium]